MRPIEEWADLKYVPGTHEAHIFPWGDHRPLCQGRTFFERVDEEELRGTGSWEETEHAKRLPLCVDCHAVVDDRVLPKREVAALLTEYDPAVVMWSEALGIES